MKKLLSIFFIFTITTLPAMAVKCTGLSDILVRYCDDDGYKYASSNKKAYGTYSTTTNSVKFGCYTYKNTNVTALKKEVAKACGISESKVTIQNDLRRDSGQINKSTKEPAVPSGVICGMDRDSGRLKEEYIDVTEQYQDILALNADMVIVSLEFGKSEEIDVIREYEQVTKDVEARKYIYVTEKMRMEW